MAFPSDFAAQATEVDVDDSSARIPTRRFCQGILESSWFGTATGFIICLNAITIGVEQSLALEGKDTTVIEVIESIFLCIYIAELSTWFLGHGMRCLYCNWVKLDCFFVALGVLTTWLVPLCMTGSDSSSLTTLTVLRTMRLLRLARTVRMLYKFKELWILVSGFMASGCTMFYTLVLLSLILYCATCMATELVTNNPVRDEDQSFGLVAGEFFPNLPVTMLSLAGFIAMDSVSGFYTPLILADVKLSIFFMMLILIVSIVMMNLITAVIVDTALENTSKNEKAKKAMEMESRKKVVERVERMLHELDGDGSGELSRAKLLGAPEEVREEVIRMMQVDTLDEVIAEVGGLNENNGIRIDELCSGIVEVAEYDGPIEIRRLANRVSAVKAQVRVIEAQLSDNVSRIEGRLDEICGILGCECPQRPVAEFPTQVTMLKKTPAKGKKSSQARKPTTSLSIGKE